MPSVPGRILYIGSSLTGAFKVWNMRRGTRNADHVIGHGAMWVAARNRRPDVFRLSGTTIRCDRTFDVGTPGAPQVLTVRTDDPTDEGGDEVAIDLLGYSAVVFTVPSLFRVESLRLWRDGHFLSTAGPPSREDRAERHLAYPVSDSAFVAVHRGLFEPAHAFLAAVRAVRPDVPVFLTPAILPRPDQTQYATAWRRRHLAEIDTVQRHLAAEFGAIAVAQPESTIGEAWTTRPGFAADDVHHFTLAFVQRLAEETAFSAILDLEDVPARATA